MANSLNDTYIHEAGNPEEPKNQCQEGSCNDCYGRPRAELRPQLASEREETIPCGYYRINQPNDAPKPSTPICRCHHRIPLDRHATRRRVGRPDFTAIRLLSPRRRDRLPLRNPQRLPNTFILLFSSCLRQGRGTAEERSSLNVLARISHGADRKRLPSVREYDRWSRSRRVIGKAEHLAKGANPRAVRNAG